MGTKGREIVGLDVNEVIEDLRSAYADEWLASHGYSYMAKVVAGRTAARAIAAGLKHLVEEELEHQDELAERITTLGGKPPATFQQITECANAPFPDIPDDETDIEDIIKTVVEAEQGAIEVYQNLAEKTQGRDHLTYELAVHILAEEVEHEDEFEDIC